MSEEPKPKRKLASNIIARDKIIEECAHLFDGSMKRWAGEIHKLHPERSAGAWNIALRRWKKGSGKERWAEILQIYMEMNEEEVGSDVRDLWASAEYHYDAEHDIYITYLRAAGESISVPGETHRAMRQAYSNWDGQPSSMNQIARDFQFPRIWFDEYRRRHHWTHDMDPFTDEEMTENTVDELVEDLVLKRRQALHVRYEKRKWKEVEQEAQKWRDFNESVLNDIRGNLITAPLDTPKIKIQTSERPYALVMSPTDFHWGKYGWEDEVGEDFGFDEAERRLIDTTSELLSRLPGRPEKVIVSTGSDWFHVDNYHGGTTKGTIQDMQGSPAQILMSGCELARKHIEMLRQVAPVEVVFMPGNHDRHSALTLMLYLSAAYEPVEDVEVIISPADRQYRVYGETLMGFTHGDGAKINQLPSIMAGEKRVEWGQCQHKVWFTGHLHHQQVKEAGGALMIQLPSLAGHDRYHAHKGYVLARAGLMAHFVDRDHGIVGSLFSPVVHSE